MSDISPTVNSFLYMTELIKFRDPLPLIEQLLWHLFGEIFFSGGETIREINRQSGAHCELSRDPPPNQHERVFRIQGNPEQVQAAIRLINEKTGQVFDNHSLSLLKYLTVFVYNLFTGRVRIHDKTSVHCVTRNVYLVFVNNSV